MIRNLKVLGLALVAVLAMSAVAASGASATETTGELTPEGNQSFFLTGSDHVDDLVLLYTSDEEAGVHCDTTHYVAEKFTTETGESIPSGAMDVTVTPKYDDCTFAGAFPATVTMNGCDFDLSLGDTIPGGEDDDYSVLSQLTCHDENKVEVHIYLSQEAHEAEQSFCTITIESQAGLKGATVTDQPESGHLTLGGAVEGISQTQEGVCEHDPSTTGVLQLGATLKGVDKLGEGAKEVPVNISHQERE